MNWKGLCGIWRVGLHGSMLTMNPSLKMTFVPFAMLTPKQQPSSPVTIDPVGKLSKPCPWSRAQCTSVNENSKCVFETGPASSTTS